MEDMAYFDLIDLVEKQGKIIKQQAETIAKLVNENVEKENMINEFMKDVVY